MSAFLLLLTVCMPQYLTYKFTYPYSTPDLVEDHYIVIDTTGGKPHGWYYGTTDDFDEAREGYTPGFFAAAMQKFTFAKDSIAFSLTIDAKQIFEKPVPRAVRDPATRKAARWSTVPLAGTRAYSGKVAGDSIVLRVGRERRVFRRIH